MLPKVVLSGSDVLFSFKFGTALLEFLPGKAQKVPVAVALALKEKKNDQGKPLFKVRGLPKIIVSNRSPIVKQPQP